MGFHPCRQHDGRVQRHPNRPIINSPEGRISNYRGRSGADPTLRFGLQGFTKRVSDGKIYAWYGSDLVEVSTKTIVYSSAPDYTHGYFRLQPEVPVRDGRVGEFLDRHGKPE